MSSVKVSIIIATFNAAEVLKTALESVKKQSFQDWECIIVDGASKDNTIEIASSYERDDSRFRHISEPDKGIYDAFNKGWKLARGEWIYYLGADDELLPNAFESLFSKDNNADIVYGNMFYKTERGLKHEIQMSPEKLRGNMVSHQSMVMKRSLIETMNGFDLHYRICGDFDLFQRCFYRGCVMQHIDVDMAIFNCCGGASSVSYKFAKECYCVRKKYAGVFKASAIMVKTMAKYLLKIIIK